jgi:hypothetical protein
MNTFITPEGSPYRKLDTSYDCNNAKIKREQLAESLLEYSLAHDC